MSVSFDIGILPNRPVSECLELARAAEDFGYGGVWLADSQCVMLWIIYASGQSRRGVAWMT